MQNNVLKVVALVAALVLFSVAIYVYRPQHDRLARITVVGDSQTKVPPDTSAITFSVVTQGKQALDAQQQNAAKSEAVKKAVEAVVTETHAEIKTANYSVSPEQDYSYSSRMPKITGYTVTNTVTVRVNSLDKVGAIVDAATDAGANSVEGIQFVLAETSPAQGEALSLATQQALAKAEAIAKAMNGKIARVVESTEAGVPLGSPDERNLALSSSSNSMAYEAKKSITTPVEAGALNIHAVVSMVVEIER
jgi:uncharacterized protein YggE